MHAQTEKCSHPPAELVTYYGRIKNKEQRYRLEHMEVILFLIGRYKFFHHLAALSGKFHRRHHETV